MPAWRSSRWPSCEIRSSSVPDPMAYFFSSYSRAALSAEMMKPAVPSALWMPEGLPLTEEAQRAKHGMGRYPKDQRSGSTRRGRARKDERLTSRRKP